MVGGGGYIAVAQFIEIYGWRRVFVEEGISLISHQNIDGYGNISFTCHGKFGAIFGTTKKMYTGAVFRKQIGIKDFLVK